MAPVLKKTSVVMDCAFLCNMEATPEVTTWKAKLSLMETNTKFKLDTGAEVVAVSDLIYQSLSSKHPA